MAYEVMSSFSIDIFQHHLSQVNKKVVAHSARVAVYSYKAEPADMIIPLVRTTY